MIDECICSSGDGSKVKYALILVLHQLNCRSSELLKICVIFTHHSVDLALLLTLLFRKISHLFQEELNLHAKVLKMYVSVLLSLSKSQKGTPDLFYQVRSEVQISYSREDFSLGCTFTPLLILEKSAA